MPILLAVVTLFVRPSGAFARWRRTLFFFFCSRTFRVQKRYFLS